MMSFDPRHTVLRICLLDNGCGSGQLLLVRLRIYDSMDKLIRLLFVRLFSCL